MLEDGRVYEITIEEYSKPRTLDQNSAFHAGIKEIVKYSGQDFDTVKLMVLLDAVDMDYPCVMLDDVRYPLPTSGRNTKEMNIAINALVMKAAFLDIALKLDYDKTG